MAGNRNLHAAKTAKNDEFYTQLTDIEKELAHYREHFRDKAVFCNCNDGLESAFWKYFHLNFGFLGLRKLIATSYGAEKPAYRLEYCGGDDGNVMAATMTCLAGNGDFRSPECAELLEECDIVATNPPFSMMSEYLPMLLESGKGFIVLGTLNHITLRPVLPYILNTRCWLGTHPGQMHVWFRVPDGHAFHATDYREDPDGSKRRRIAMVCWFTNLDIERRHEPLVLVRSYDPAAYPRYDDYDAIECGRSADIPYDYYGVIGVPITYLAWHCHEQFEILGLVTPKLNGKTKYKRLLIRRRGYGGEG